MTDDQRDPRPPPAVDFRAPSSRGQTLGLEAFLGKIPVLMTSASDPHDPEERAMLVELDRNEIEFGRRRVQLLAVIRATAREIRTLSDEQSLTLTLVADPGGAITRSYGLEPDDATTRRAALVDCDGGITPVVGNRDDPGEWTRFLVRSVEDAGLLDSENGGDDEPVGPRSQLSPL